MTTPVEPTSWGSIEWGLTTVGTILAAIIGFVMNTNGKINSNAFILAQTEEKVNNMFENLENIKDKLAVRPTHEDISRLILGMEMRLESRLNQIDQHLSRIDERIDNIPRKNYD